MQVIPGYYCVIRWNGIVKTKEYYVQFVESLLLHLLVFHSLYVISCMCCTLKQANISGTCPIKHVLMTSPLSCTITHTHTETVGYVLRSYNHSFVLYPLQILNKQCRGQRSQSATVPSRGAQTCHAAGSFCPRQKLSTRNGLATQVLLGLLCKQQNKPRNFPLPSSAYLFVF